MKGLPYILAKVFLSALVITGILAPTLSTDKSLASKRKDGTVEWYVSKSSLDNQWTIRAPIPYLPTTIDKSSLRWRPPGTYSADDRQHWLGTSKLGKDVAAGMIWGCRTAIIVGSGGAIIALFIGLLLGLTSGYLGNQVVRISAAKLVIGLLATLVFLHYLAMALLYLSVVDLVICLLAFLTIIALYKWPKKIGPTVALPIDNLILRFIEIRKSIPVMYLLLSIGVYISSHTVWSLSLVIGCIIWTAIARHTRAYTLDLKGQDQILAARSLGYSHIRIITHHILPQIWPQIKVLALFAISTGILLEATLSYLGLGLSGESLTWGNMISEARSNPSAWWMAVFPGLMISLTLISLRTIGSNRPILPE